MAPTLRLANMPWNFTRSDLIRHFVNTLDSRVRETKIIYNKNTGLSRGVAKIELVDDDFTKDLLRRGSMEIDGRTVPVTRWSDRPRAQRALNTAGTKIEEESNQ